MIRPDWRKTRLSCPEWQWAVGRSGWFVNSLNFECDFECLYSLQWLARYIKLHQLVINLNYPCLYSPQCWKIPLPEHLALPDRRSKSSVDSMYADCYRQLGTVQPLHSVNYYLDVSRSAALLSDPLAFIQPHHDCYAYWRSCYSLQQQ